MRAGTRLFAKIKPGRFLDPNSPTGLTGLFTHPAPRSTLIYLYSSTLDKLKAFPESSAYRQATEALTKQRLSIVEAVKPAGYDEWAERARKQITENAEVFNTPQGGVDHEGGKHVGSVFAGRSFVTTKMEVEQDERLEEWDGEKDTATLEGTRSTKERAIQSAHGAARPGSDVKTITWEEEPQLDADQISEIETQIGAGLIEEVIQVAEGELTLVDTMAESKVWEELEEKPVEGQWKYAERDSHIGTS